MGLQSIRDVIVIEGGHIDTLYFLGSKTFKCLQHPVNLRLKHHSLLLCVHKLYTVV